MSAEQLIEGSTYSGLWIPRRTRHPKSKYQSIRKCGDIWTFCPDFLLNIEAFFNKPNFYASISGHLVQIWKNADIKPSRYWSIETSKYPDIELSRYQSIWISKHEILCFKIRISGNRGTTVKLKSTVKKYLLFT